MSDVFINVALVLLFILVGGVFAGAEMALVSLRDGQVRGLEGRGGRGAKVAAVHADPNRFLAAVQIGVTLAGFLSAAFGAATLADDLAPVLVDWGLSVTTADVTSLVVITILISYVSIVLGELVAKRIGLQRAVPVALAVAPAVDRFANLMRPVIWLLSKSTNAVVRLIGLDPMQARERMSREELRTLVATAEGIDSAQRDLIDEVFAAAGRQIREVMRPRTEVDFLAADLPAFKAVKELAELPHSRYPVIGDSPDDVLGFLHVRDLLAPDVASRSVRVDELVRPVARFPGTKHVLDTMTEMRAAGQHLAVVVDEYGGTAGIVTLEDLVEELVGDIRDEYDHPEAGTRVLGSAVEIDGLLNVDDFIDVGGCELPEGPYDTVAGFVMAELGRVPEVGAAVLTGDVRLVVTALDGRRVARIRVEPRGLEQ